MDSPTENMILRTVYLPKELDLQLRDLAFKHSKSKGEFMRQLIIESLQRRAAEGDVAVGELSAPGPEVRLLEVAAAAKAPPAKAARKKRAAPRTRVSKATKAPTVTKSAAPTTVNVRRTKTRRATEDAGVRAQLAPAGV